MYVAVFRTTGNAFTPGATSRDRADMIANVEARGIVGEDLETVKRRAAEMARATGVPLWRIAVMDFDRWSASF